VCGLSPSSFFLAETTKYLYLLFDPDNFIHNNGSSGTVVQTPNGECVIDAGGYFFNTEAHPIDTAAVYCCSAAKKENDAILQSMHDKLSGSNNRYKYFVVSAKQKLSILFSSK
jgi:mannosidase alpha-like ER degradation enhancer 2